MEYYFNNLDPTSFQRLVNGILTARFGVNLRLTPLRGKDGGKDAEIEFNKSSGEIVINKDLTNSHFSSPSKGRYIFQVKHHRTVDARPSDVRNTVINDFENELKKNVLTKTGEKKINFFFLITNVPCSREAQANLDIKRQKLLKGFENLHADVWWQEQVVAFLDQLPQLWISFPQLFAGEKVPFLGNFVNNSADKLSRSIRLALETQYKQESNVKFRQIELDQSLNKLFIDLNISSKHLDYGLTRQLVLADVANEESSSYQPKIDFPYGPGFGILTNPREIRALSVLMNENLTAPKKIVLEGGPGQGKSTITQMLAQIYRSKLLNRDDLKSDGRWIEPPKVRIPFRIELRNFAEWLNQNTNYSLEKYLSYVLTRDSGGNELSVNDVQSVIEKSPSILICDGLDEIGSDDLRNIVLKRISECIDRLVGTLKSDLKIIVTTRPPAIVGRMELLPEFLEIQLAPLSKNRIDNFLNRWLAHQVSENPSRENVRHSFGRRRNEIHVNALAQNPMQLSVLLHFIKLKGEAFPDRRAELYKEYFKTVVDRDVEKSEKLLRDRDLIENLHQWLGYKIHSLTEAQLADGTLSREQLLKIVQEWLVKAGETKRSADEIFKIGEERLGLIVALRGEGEKSHYGFEVQPIREYFAASFINDQITGNAHDVFQTMLSSSYWKEVALFLAGLRRPNEKADLISRAKVIDRGPENGWRQDGRAITLQLLQEGVFSYPNNICSDALSFIVDILDPSQVKVANAPTGALDSIAKLINQFQSVTQKERILEIAKQQKITADHYSIYRLYKVLSQILEEEQFQEEVLNFSGNEDNLKEKLRILWSASWGVDINTFSQKDRFWSDVNEDYLAISWWEAGQFNNTVGFLDAPVSYHSRLIEQYAINPVSIFEIFKHGDFKTNGEIPPWAIWRFTAYQQLLAALSNFQNVELLKNINSIEPPQDTDYVGLEEDLKTALKKLSTSLHFVLKTILIGGKDFRNAIQNYLEVITEELTKPGLRGWIACRSALNLFEIKLSLMHSKDTIITSDNADLRLLSSARGSIMEGLRSKAARNLWKETFLFYSQKKSTSLSNIERLLTSEIYGDYTFYFSFLNQKRCNYLPIKLRLEPNGELLGIEEFIFEKIRNQRPLPFQWMEKIPWTLRAMRPIIEECRSDLIDTLKYLGSKVYNSSSLNSSFNPLLVQDTQRILKVVRSSNDQDVLSGALFALCGSRFLNIISEADLLKLLEASESHSYLADYLFTAHDEFKYIKTGTPNPKLIKVANKIVQNPNRYSVGICMTVATFLATHTTKNSMPLIRQEEELEIQI